MHASRYASYIKTGGNRIALGENSTSWNKRVGSLPCIFFFKENWVPLSSFGPAGAQVSQKARETAGRTDGWTNGRADGQIGR